MEKNEEKRIPFKSNGARRISLVIDEFTPDFAKKRKMRLRKGLLLALIELYPEDGLAIKQVIFGENSRELKKEIDQRNGVPPNVEPPNLKNHAGSGECQGCDKEPLRHHSDIIEDVKAKATVEMNTVGDILARFSKSTPAIRAFAGTLGVDIPGNVRKPETAAKMLLEGLKKQV